MLMSFKFGFILDLGVINPSHYIFSLFKHLKSNLKQSDYEGKNVTFYYFWGVSGVSYNKLIKVATFLSNFLFFKIKSLLLFLQNYS